MRAHVARALECFEAVVGRYADSVEEESERREAHVCVCRMVWKGRGQSVGIAGEARNVIA